MNYLSIENDQKWPVLGNMYTFLKYVKNINLIISNVFICNRWITIATERQMQKLGLSCRLARLHP